MIDYRLLAKELRIAFSCFIIRLSQVVDLQEVYAIGMYVNEELQYVSPTANTVYEQIKPTTRWLPPDWKYHLYAQECFEKVEEILLQGWDADYANYHIDKSIVIAIYTDILLEVRTRFFQNTETVVGIFMGGMANNVVISSVKQINPEAVAKRFTDTLS